MPRGFASPNNPPGRVHTAGGRATYREICRHVSPRFRLHPLLLSRSAHSHAVRLEIPHPLRTARVPTIELPSRGFSCCCTSQRPQGYHPPCVQLRFHHRKVPTMVVQQPSLQHLRWLPIVPHRTPLVPRARMLVFILTSSPRARPYSNILTHEAAPEPTLIIF